MPKASTWSNVFSQSADKSNLSPESRKQKPSHSSSFPSLSSLYGPQKGASSLCIICREIFLVDYPFKGAEDPWRTPEYIHHRTVKSLSTSANFGCQICLKLWDIFDASQEESFDNDSVPIATSKYFIADERTKAFSGNMYELHVYLSSEYSSTGPLEFLLQPIKEVSDCIFTKQISEKILRGSSMDLAREWLNRCRKHDICNRKLANCPTDWVPTRLVDVSRSDRLRIVTTETSGIRKPYMTLSHVWGGNLEFKLKRDNLEELQKGFPTSLLPRTHADAIAVCKQFKVNYIWIDNLCILQNTVEDFEREADSMAKIYGNAVCNISATAANDGRQGLFRKRPVRSLDICEVMIRWRTRPREKYVILDRSIWTEGVVRAPANRRAWIVQERLLAKRVLHFGSQQLFWECHELEACEIWPKGLPTMVLGDDHGFKNYDVRFGNMAIRAIDDFPGYRDWNRILYTYTRSKLSFPRDKLVALAGIASRIQSLVGGDYIAGLWRSYLPSELLWRARTWGLYSVRAEPYRAPSWSWASVDFEITTHLPQKNDMRPRCFILDARVVPLTENFFGQIVFGIIRMRAKLYTSKKLQGKKYMQEPNDISMFAMDVDPFSIETETLYFCIVDETPLLPRENPAWRDLVLESTGRSSAEGNFRRVGYFHIAKLQILSIFDTPDIDRDNEYPSEFFDMLLREHIFTII